MVTYTWHLRVGIKRDTTMVEMGNAVKWLRQAAHTTRGFETGGIVGRATTLLLSAFQTNNKAPVPHFALIATFISTQGASFVANGAARQLPRTPPNPSESEQLIVLETLPLVIARPMIARKAEFEALTSFASPTSSFRRSPHSHLAGSSYLI